MKKFTHHLKTLFLFCLLAIGENSSAQSSCTLNAMFFPYPTDSTLSALFYNYTGAAPSVTYVWDFGDGNTSTLAQPTHTYAANGVYTITLIATDTLNLSCTSTFTKALTFCNANFTYSVLGGGVVSFSDISTGTTSSTYYYWDMAPATFSSGISVIQPTATYASTGIYNVYMGISGSAPTCTSAISKNITVTTYPSISPCLNALFSYTAGTGGLVNFSNTSANTTASSTFTWDYGDASLFGTGINPSHTYTANGVYAVTLLASDTIAACGTSSMTILLSVCVNPIVPSFTYSVNPGGIVTFSSTSTGTNSTSTYYYWFFLGASPNVIGNNLNQATATFSANGTYSVYLSIWSTANTCAASIIQTIVVNAPPCVNALFSYTTGSSGLVNFSSTSTNTTAATSYTWDYGDGSPTGTGTNASHTYTANGTYYVVLLATNTITGCGISSTTLAINICLNPIVPSFTYSVNPGDIVTFTSSSTGTTSTSNYFWFFYGANTQSLGVNLTQPTVTYPVAGTYSVLLGLSDAAYNCSVNVVQAVTVNSVTCVADASFTLLPTGTPQYWDAIPAFPSNVTAAEWNWGDGTTTDSLYTSHLYASAGAYNICLSVSVSCGATATVCTNYSIFRQMKTDQNKNMIRVNVIKQMQPLGIKNIQAENIAYSIYPNPNNGEFELKISGLNSSTARIAIYDLMGEKVYNEEIQTLNGDLNKGLNLSGLSSGVYLIKINSGNTQKLVISK